MHMCMCRSCSSVCPAATLGVGGWSPGCYSMLREDVIHRLANCYYHYYYYHHYYYHSYHYYYYYYHY